VDKETLAGEAPLSIGETSRASQLHGPTFPILAIWLAGSLTWVGFGKGVGVFLEEGSDDDDDDDER
jgi:hypothetical protein